MGVVSEGINIIGAGAAGGITGIIGTFGSRLFAYFERKQAHKFAVKKWEEDEKVRAFQERKLAQEFEHEKQLHQLNQQAAQEEFERLVISNEQETSRQGLGASIAHETALVRETGSQWVVNLIRLVRPFLTVLSLIMLAVLFFFVPQEVRAVIINALIYAGVGAFPA